jgi:hypothetical protein
MSSVGAASLAALLSPARAAASRKNGAKSRGPRTPEGKARSAQNALKHGLRAQQYVVLPEEDAAAFAAREAALLAELAPQGALQRLLAGRIVAAAWRLERAERIEAEVFAREMHGVFGEDDLGLALIRDCNGAGAFKALLRYRGAALAEFWRALRTLQALQAPRAAQQVAAAADSGRATPIKPERRANPGDGAPEPAPAGEAAPAAVSAPAHPAPRGAAPAAPPIEPEPRGNPGEATPSMPRASVARGGAAALLAAPALVPLARRSSP